MYKSTKILLFWRSVLLFVVGMKFFHLEFSDRNPKNTRKLRRAVGIAALLDVHKKSRNRDFDDDDGQNPMQCAPWIQMPLDAILIEVHSTDSGALTA